MTFSRRVAALAVLSTGVAAFKNTSPFFLYSTSELSVPAEPAQLASAHKVAEEVSNLVNRCPSDAYIIVNQPGVSAVDFATKNSAPHLQSWLNSTYSTKGTSAWTVPEVAGQVDTDSLSNVLQKICDATVIKADASTGDIPSGHMKPRIISIDFDSLTDTSPRDRSLTLAEHDSFLHAVVSSLGGTSHTILYFTSPPSVAPLRSSNPSTYSMDSQYDNVLHQDLKREMHARASTADNRTNSDLPLFEKYQFFTPGIFVGLFVTFLLLSILYVALSAISGLQVSYFAFSKEMGPAAQKKLQ